MKQNRALRPLMAGLLAAAILSACAPPFSRKSATMHQAWPSAGVKRVVVDAVNGRIEVVAGDPSKIDLTADIRVRARDPQREIEKGLVKTRLEGDTLYVSETRRRKNRHVFMIPIVRTNEAQIDYRIVVPQSVNLELVNVNGRIQVSGIAGETEARSVNGTIDVMKTGGELYAKTVNGRVRAEFAKDFRGARVKTVNGSIAVSLPSNSSFDFDVTQLNGSFRSNIPMEMNSGGRHKAGGAVNGGQYPLELSTVNGSVSVERREAVPEG